MLLANRGKAVVRRHKDGSGNGAPGGKVRSKGGAEAPSEYDNASLVDVLPQRDRIVDRQCIGAELGFAGRALARSVAPVIQARDRPLARPMCVRQRPGYSLRMPPEVDDGGRQSRRAFDDPAVEALAVGGDDLQRLCPRRQVRRRDDGLWKEDKPLLRQPRYREDAEDDSGSENKPLHRFTAAVHRLPSLDYRRASHRTFALSRTSGRSRA